MTGEPAYVGAIATCRWCGGVVVPYRGHLAGRCTWLDDIALQFEQIRADVRKFKP